MAATVAASVVLYLFLAVVARSLAPDDYGLFESLFGLVVFSGIVATAIQTMTAGRVANAATEDLPPLVAKIVYVSTKWTVALLLLLALLTPGLKVFLHASGDVPVLAACVVATTLVPWSVLLGIYQGLRRFKPFGWMTLLQAATRLCAAAVLFWTRSLSVLLIAVAASIAVPLLVGWLLLGELRATAIAQLLQNGWRRMPRTVGDTRLRTLLRTEFGWIVLTVVVVAFPTVGDVVVVRHVYPPREAGLYAGVALVGRCVLFLTVGINSVFFPRYLAIQSNQERARLRGQGVMLTAVICGAAATILAIAPSLTLRVIVGSGYSAASNLVRVYLGAAFAYSIVSAFAYFHLATRNRKYFFLVLVPGLCAGVVLPVIIDQNLVHLVVGTVAVSAAMVLASLVVTRFVPRPASGW